ncbi:pyridoxamine 5'-phosphate oxidase family protein [bacterium RCC_150]
MFDHEDPVLELDEAQCWKLLERAGYGRIVLSAVGDTEIFPVNYRPHEGVLLLRTAPGTKLAALTVNENVLFEVDEVNDGSAWSVVVRGSARILTGGELETAEKLGLKTWVPTLKDFYVEIKPTRISGRHFNLGEQPERF